MTKLSLISCLLVCFFLASCGNYGSADQLKASKVKSITETTITLANGESFDIPHSGNSDYHTLVLTRHAEKKSDEKNPRLTDAGTKRAENLKDILLPMQPERCYTTSPARCVFTTMPLAKAIKSPNAHYQATDYYSLFDTIIKEHKAKKALIVGHSNTIPEMLNLLVGEKKYEEFDENEYSRLFLVVTKGLGDSEVLELSY
ncbi:MAG: 2,3-bisphosphoglycerate-dependent phosphoglycerate mutase [Saprospiraceae bacterium]|jgi:2,3-bisphosphoglycerate-dependent phosphoglycerate mutase